MIEYDADLYCNQCHEKIERVYSLESTDSDRTIAQFVRDVMKRHESQKHSSQ